MRQRLPSSIQRTGKLTIIWYIPDVYFVRRRISSACPEQKISVCNLWRLRLPTTSEPLPIRAIRHSMPSRFVDWVVETMCGFKFLFEEFTIVVVFAGCRIVWNHELTEGSVWRVCYEAAKRRMVRKHKLSWWNNSPAIFGKIQPFDCSITTSYSVSRY